MMVANSSNLIITIRPANQRKAFNPKASSQPHPQNLNNNISHHSDHRMKSISQPYQHQYQQYSNRHQSAKQIELNNQRIPLNENTPILRNKLETIDKMPLHMVNLADGESDSDDDEIKEHNLGNHGNHNSQSRNENNQSNQSYQTNRGNNLDSVSNNQGNVGNLNKEQENSRLKEENDRILRTKNY